MLNLDDASPDQMFEPRRSPKGSFLEYPNWKMRCEQPTRRCQKGKASTASCVLPPKTPKLRIRASLLPQRQNRLRRRTKIALPRALDPQTASCFSRKAEKSISLASRAHRYTYLLLSSKYVFFLSFSHFRKRRLMVNFSFLQTSFADAQLLDDTTTVPFVFAETTAEQVLQHFAHLPPYDETAIYIQSYTENVSWMYSIVNLRRLSQDVKAIYSSPNSASSSQLHPHRLAVFFMVIRCFLALWKDCCFPHPVTPAGSCSWPALPFRLVPLR
jgi:hypothetical protein